MNERKWTRATSQAAQPEYPESNIKSSRQRWAIAAAVVYTLAVLVVAVFAGNRLYDWARLRILASSPVSEYTDWVALIPATMPQTDLDAAPVLEDPQVDAVDAESSQVAPPAPAIPAVNILLLGTDARPGEGGFAFANTDTMILLTLDPQHQTAGMLSLPRDLYVPLPGYGYSVKINTAFRTGETTNYPNGGAQLAKDTVSSFIGEPVHYYVKVDFQGFVELIDLIGGVEVDVPKTIYDPEYPTENYGFQVFYIEAGRRHLDGATALKYVRTRNVDGDYSRARRQQQVLRAVADKVLRTDMLSTLLPKVPSLLRTMRNSILTDVPVAQQLEFANFFSSGSLPVRQLVLDNQFGIETYTEEGMWILLPDRSRVRPAVAAFFEPPSMNLADAVASAYSDGVRIEVLNGTGEPGIAARTRDLLHSHGWQNVSIGDADRNDYGRTIIINYGVPDELVERVGVDLELEPNISSLHGLNATAPVDVRIVVGRDILTHLR